MVLPPATFHLQENENWKGLLVTTVPDPKCPNQSRVALPKPAPQQLPPGAATSHVERDVRPAFLCPHWGLGTGIRRVGVGYKPTDISGWGKVAPWPIWGDNTIAHSAGDSQFRIMPS